MESSAPLILLLGGGGGSAHLILLWGGGWAPLAPPTLSPGLIFKYGISYRLLQNFNSFATLKNSHLIRVLVGLVPSI